MSPKQQNTKQQIIQKLEMLTNHSYIEVLTRGNAAIWSAFHAVKKEILIPEEGGWLTYFQYPEKLKLGIELTVSDERIVKNLPKDQDIYILHLSNIDEQNLKELREAQPWSYIVGLSRADGLPKEVGELVNIHYNWLLSQDHLERILQQDWTEKGFTKKD